MIYGIVYAVGCVIAAVSSLAALKCDGDHNTHVCPTGAERVVGTVVLTVGWPLVIPLFAAHKLVAWLRGRR